MTGEREIGVIGTVVQDTIDRPGEETVRDIGGTYHSVIAMSVLLPRERWRCRSWSSARTP